MNKMISVKSALSIVCIFLMLPAIGAYAHTDDYTQAIELIGAGIPCESLNDTQLEAIGDYYMELSHPGDEHERMDEMMGGEGSESLKQMHISIAERTYCDRDDGMMAGGESMMDDYLGMAYGGFFGFLFMILFWGLVIWLIIVLIRSLSETGRKETTESPMDILKRRYAQGEITKKQFEDMKKDIGNR